MAKSIDFAADASRLAALLLSYILAVCALVAPCQPGASTATIDRLSHSRALSSFGIEDPPLRGVALLAAICGLPGAHQPDIALTSIGMDHAAVWAGRPRVDAVSSARARRWREI